MTLELGYTLVSLNYVRKLRYDMVILYLCLFVTKKLRKNTKLLRTLLAEYRQFQVPTIIFDKKKLPGIFLVSPGQRTYNEIFLSFALRTFAKDEKQCTQLF